MKSRICDSPAPASTGVPADAAFAEAGRIIAEPDGADQ